MSTTGCCGDDTEISRIRATSRHGAERTRTRTRGRSRGRTELKGNNISPFKSDLPSIGKKGISGMGFFSSPVKIVRSSSGSVGPKTGSEAERVACVRPQTSGC